MSCLIHASCWANAPRWGGRLRCWLAAPLPLPQTWTCCAVQIVTRVPLSLYLGPRLVNVVSLRKRPNSLYLQHKLSPYPDALQHLFPSPPVLRQLLPLRHLQLTQQRLHPSYLLAVHCCFLLPPPLLLSRVRTHRRRTARRLLRCCCCYWSRTACSAFRNFTLWLHGKMHFFLAQNN